MNTRVLTIFRHVLTALLLTPLAASAAAVIDHMNDDHRDALREYCLAFSRARDFATVTMTGIDRYGFEMSVETDDGDRPVRVAFDEPLTSPDEVRPVLVELVRRARAQNQTDAM